MLVARARLYGWGGIMIDEDPNLRSSDEDQIILISLQTALAASRRLKRGFLAYLIDMAIIQLMDDRKSAAKTQLRHNRK